MGYPVAYRHGARAHGGGSFQEPAPQRQPVVDPMHPPYRDPPKPANDPWPVPANDNEPRGRYTHPRFPKLPPWPGKPARGRSMGGRFRLPGNLPVQIAFDVAMDVLQYYADVRNMPQVQLSGGWYQYCGPTVPVSGYPGRYAFHKLGGSNIACGLGGQALGLGSVGWPAYTSSDLWMILAKFNDSVTVPRLSIVSQWNRTNNSQNPRIPTVWPSVGPIAPYEVPVPLPATVSNPLPAFIAPPVGNAMPDRVSNPRPYPGSVPRNPAVYESNSRAPSYVGSIDPSKPGVVISPDSPLPPRQPPGRRTKERKATEVAPGFVVGALKAASGVYEDAKFANDIINAFYAALPGKHAAKTPQDKLAEIYQRYDEIDVNKAIAGVLKAVAYEHAGAYIDRVRRTASNNLGLHMHIQIPTGGGPRV